MQGLIWVHESNTQGLLDAVTSLELAKASVAFSWHAIREKTIETEEVSSTKVIFTVKAEHGNVIGTCTFKLAYLYDTITHL